eukprot:TRINITY_DN1991_c0_g3_i2.p1 TRINITY_DN1991_c0_g3~~TRINITY_DN1991_c0_g3_i2.p1  ORF type:complete len:285 (+),score=70.26 TRINITY_DN1991_c0_g3_i2:47-856(+)
MSCCPPGSHGFLAHDYKAIGKETSAGGVEVYETGTAVDKKMTIIVGDVWGWDGGRVRQIADQLGGLVVIAKMMKPYESGTNGDALPPDFNIGEKFAEIVPHLKENWTPEVVLPQLKKVMTHYRTQGIEECGMIGYCYGCWIISHLCQGEETPLPVKCAVMSHPSLGLEGVFERDPTALASKVNIPVMIHQAKEDDSALYGESGSIFAAFQKNSDNKSKTIPFPEMHHGFVTRGAIKNGFSTGSGDEVEKAVTKALSLTVEFLKEFKILA